MFEKLNICLVVDLSFKQITESRQELDCFFNRWNLHPSVMSTTRSSGQLLERSINHLTATMSTMAFRDRHVTSNRNNPNRGYEYTSRGSGHHISLVRWHAAVLVNPIGSSSLRSCGRRRVRTIRWAPTSASKTHVHSKHKHDKK